MRSQTMSAIDQGTSGPVALDEEAFCLRTKYEELKGKYDDLETREMYFRHLTEYSVDLIAILDPDGTIRFESRSVETYLGHPPAHYRGQNFFEFVHPEDQQLVQAAFADALRKRGNTPVIRFRFCHRDGSYRVLEGCGNNLLDDPAVRGIVFNSRDVTEEVQLREEVELARNQNEQMIARLTGGIAHDFNNVLTAIQGFAELTQSGLEPASKEARYLEDLQASTRRAGALTQRLLAISHRLVLQPRGVNLAKWVAEMRPRFEAILGPSIELTLALHQDPWVVADPALLGQVLLHLVENARDAMPAGGRLTIEALPTILGPGERPRDGKSGFLNYVKISVADNGCGMTEGTLSRIYEPFFTTKEPTEHSGLGLSMCRGIIEQSGGHLSVNSIPGRGTVFHLFVPAGEMLADESDSSPTGLIPDGTSSDKPLVFVVDDEPALQEIALITLEQAGYRVLVASDGPSALQRISELGAPPDLLLTDVVMPGMSGVQLAHEVMAQWPGTRILLCSGYTRDALDQNGSLPKGISFLSKPYTLAGLVKKVEEIVRGSLPEIHFEPQNQHSTPPE